MARRNGWIGGVCASMIICGAALGRAAPTTIPAIVSPTAFDAQSTIAQAPELAKMLSATPVTLSVHDVTTTAAIDELSKVTGYKIARIGGGPPNFGVRKMTLSASGEPFWAVVRELCFRGNVTLYPYGGPYGGAVTLAPLNYGWSDLMRTSTSIRGPFMVMIQSVRRTNSVDMSSPAKVSRAIMVQCLTCIEPKVHIDRISYRPIIDEAVDENGNAMIPADNQQQGMQSTQNMSNWTSFELPYPAHNPGHQIARLKGHIPIILVTGTEPFEIDDPLNAAETTKTVAGKSITFKSLKANQATYTLTMTYQRGAGEDVNTFRQNPDPSQPKLTDKQGRYLFIRSVTRSLNQDVFTCVYEFMAATGNADRAPAKLRLDVPKGAQNMAIPFEFADVPMP